ncbi:hypothetical protein Tsubulata_041074 [Turnera subulata]|uniref:glutathione transferase n=1 Tax=Turnera subulata TaxID=218843 RepID=A0A9Q0JCA8_9ROSI|nr:hypothetical protein Tsubulata_041074 [Turnera subulata]
MASIKVHGNFLSTAARRVFACLYEKELDFELVPVEFKTNDHKKEPYLSLNPFGQIPAFEDGDLKMFESRAITSYIAREYGDKGTQLIYTSGKEMAEMLVWMEVEAHQYDPVVAKLVMEQQVKPLMMGLPPDAAVVEENEAKLSKVLDVYEARLAQSKYLAGDSFTLADLHHLPATANLMNTQSWKLIESRPNVSAWIADITSRPAWSKVVLALKDYYQQQQP